MTLLGAGELLRPGEIVLGPGEKYACAARRVRLAGRRVSTAMAGRGAHVAACPRAASVVAAPADPQHVGGGVLRPRSARSSWRWPSARQTVGIERFVLDDGWFLGRRDDTTSLGDWVVDRAVWPDGLGPLAERVHELGHGVRPLVRARDGQPRLRPRPRAPGVAAARSRAPRSRRCRAVLAHASTCSTSRTRTPTRTSSARSTPSSASCGIDFIKWDHNRDLVESVHDGGPGIHAQMLAVYALIAELKAAASGAGDRVVLERRRAHRPRGHGGLRPRVGERLERPGRTPGHPALDRAAAAARARRGPRRPDRSRTAPAARPTCRTGWRRASWARRGSSGTSSRATMTETRHDRRASPGCTRSCGRSIHSGDGRASRPPRSGVAGDRLRRR